jgi:hypothetical protein
MWSKPRELAEIIGRLATQHAPDKRGSTAA